MTVFTRLPRTLTTALTHVTPETLRMRMVKLRRLRHAFDDGSEKARAAEIAFGLGAGVAPEGAEFVDVPGVPPGAPVGRAGARPQHSSAPSVLIAEVRETG